MVETIIAVLGGLAVFLFGMKVMSDGLQQVAGSRMRQIMASMTRNRFSGVFTGLGVTCVVQSSSVTTVMLVSFVSAGLVTLTESVGVVMGANIGTTLTGWLVSLVGFKFHISSLAFPAVILGIVPKMTGSRKWSGWGDVAIGFGVLFLGLDFMKESVAGLKHSDFIVHVMHQASGTTLVERLVAVAIGAAVTMMIQSSSATMAITLTLAAQGLIDVGGACALVLGENIGTTITANLAAISASTTAKRTARIHLVFNIAGALWAIVLFTPFLRLVDWVVPGELLHAESLSKALLTSHIAMFHTLFNVINTAVFLPFVRPLVALSDKLVFGARDDRKEGLRFLHAGVMESVPLSLLAARKETARMIGEVRDMLASVRRLIDSPDEKMGKVAASISASEEVVDYLEKEITEYLVTIMRQEMSLEQSHEAAGLIAAVGDIERMGDHCESLHRLLARRYDKHIEFSAEAKSELGAMCDQVDRFLDLLAQHVVDSRAEIRLEEARELENSINRMRSEMRKGHIRRLNDGQCSVAAGLIYIDMLTSFEKMGDHAFNVAEFLSGVR